MYQPNAAFMIRDPGQPGEATAPEQMHRSAHDIGVKTRAARLFDVMEPS